MAAVGGVAQLGERRVRNAEVEGSSPFSSTKSFFQESGYFCRMVAPADVRDGRSTNANM